MPGAVNTTYTFTATDTITSTKMNNIIDQTVMTSESCLSSGGLEVASGKLTISANAINSSRLAANSVTSTNIVDGTIVNADISPTAAIAGTKIAASFGNQNITATGDIGLEGTASDYTAAVLNNTSGVQTQLFSNANLNGGIVTVTNHPLTLSTNNAERMRITAAGNVGIGLSAPGSKLGILSNTSNATPEGGAHGIAIQAGDGGKEINMGYDSSVDIGYINASKAGALRPVVLQSRGGNVGIGKTNPATTLDVNGTVTATAFAGPLTGNVTGNVTGSATTASACTGNSATATLATKASTLSQGGGNGAAMTFNWNGQGGQPTWLWGGNDGVNHYVYNPSNFSVNYANSAGSAGSATTASTVSNGAITAAKLDGAQSGSAPIYGVRAWVNFDASRDASGATNASNTNRFIRSSGNVTSVLKTGTGKFTVTFTFAMPNTNYIVTSSAGLSGSPRFACADRTTATTTSIEIETDDAGGAAANFTENNVMVIA